MLSLQRTQVGSFTGALSDRIGRFGAADGATLFLDELGEIPLEHQSKLLRVLQEGEFERVGESRTRKTDARIIAATNKNLAEEVEAKRFREDLYFRLNVFPIRVPPLRERTEDIIPLANHFLKLALQDMNRPEQQFTVSQLKQLQNYPWPGNVRELRNIVEQAAIYAHSGPLLLQIPESRHPGSFIPLPASPFQAVTSGADKAIQEVQRVLTEMEIVELQRDNTIAALRQCNWKIYGDYGAAALLGIKPTTLATRMKKMKLQRTFEETTTN